jgi:alcohol dehydrogenase (cytochrome c)
MSAPAGLRRLPDKVLAAALGSALIIGAAGAQVDRAEVRPVRDAELVDPPAADWLSFRGNLSTWGYSKLDRIDRDNVTQLDLAWSLTMEPGPNEPAPLVRDGVLYLPNSGDVIKALDARTGDMIWEYRRELPEDVAVGGSLAAAAAPIHRNIAIWGDGLFVSTADAHVIRLDARTGELVWESRVGDYHHTSHTSGPIIARGKVISGRACDMALPGGCYLTAHDAETGEELWRFHLIPRPGEPGDETWGDVPLEKRIHVGAWFVGSYDPELDLIYWGTSVPAPSPEILRGTGAGDMLYSNSTIALDPDTGKLVWYFQHLPRDNWDLDHPFERVLVDLELAIEDDPDWVRSPELESGKKRRVLTGVPGKTGVLWTLDRETGEFLWARETVFQNVIAGIDAGSGAVTVNQDVIPRSLEDDYGLVCPSASGGKNWPTSSYSPGRQTLFVPLQNLCMKPMISTPEPEPDDWYAIAMRGQLAPGRSDVGRLEAISLTTGRTLWRFEEPAGMLATLATAGDLVFAGNSNRRFRAFDAENGEILWQTILNSPVTGFPLSWEVDGEQYVGVGVGGGDQMTGGFNRYAGFKVRAGSNVFYAFKLSETGADSGRPASGRGGIADATTGKDPRSLPAVVPMPPRGDHLADSVPCASFSAGQAEAGRTIYDAQCAECHGATLRGGSHGAPLSGRFFRIAWRNRSTGPLHRTVRETMPPGRENTLGPRATSQLVAYLLQSAGLEASNTALPTDDEALDGLRTCVE